LIGIFRDSAAALLELNPVLALSPLHILEEITNYFGPKSDARFVFTETCHAAKCNVGEGEVLPGALLDDSSCFHTLILRDGKARQNYHSELQEHPLQQHRGFRSFLPRNSFINEANDSFDPTFPVRFR
jgi:hypothetical protein